MVQVNAIFAPFFFSILLSPISFSLSKTTLLNHELTLTFHTLLYSLHFSLFISLSFSPPPLFHPPILYSLSMQITKISTPFSSPPSPHE